MYCKEPGISIIFAVSIYNFFIPPMKVLLKFVVLGAWVLFAAALWQTRQSQPIAGAASWTLPSLGMFSISRKVNEARISVSPLSERSSLAWPTPDMLIQLSGSGL